MYKSFNIKNFRGLVDLTIEPTAQINLIAGANNVGKTAVLEALWIHHAPNSPDTGIRVNRFRGLASIDPNRLFWELFTNLDVDSQIELSAQGDWGDAPRTLKIYLSDRDIADVPIGESSEGEELSGGAANARTSPQEVVFDYTDEKGEEFVSRAYYISNFVRPGIYEEGLRTERRQIGRMLSGVFLAARQPSGGQEEIRRLSSMIEKKRDGEVVKILRHIDPRIEHLSILTRSDMPTIYADIGESQLLPVALLGDGTLRLMSVALAIGDTKGGIVLVDEIENGLYYQAMEKVWEGIREIAEISGVQIFATTHSDECLRAAHRAFSRMDEYNFRFHRLDRVNNKIRSVTFDQEMIETAIRSGLEVR